MKSSADSAAPRVNDDSWIAFWFQLNWGDDIADTENGCTEESDENWKIYNGFVDALYVSHNYSNAGRETHMGSQY